MSNGNRDTSFYINNTIIPKVDDISYLGVKINKNLDFKNISIVKFKEVQKSVFSLSFLGLKPQYISPGLQSFIYKTYCLSQFTKGLETTVLNEEARNYLNICQNNILRQILGLRKFSHVTRILKTLKIFSFEDLYIFTKLSFLENIKNNEISL